MSTERTDHVTEEEIDTLLGTAETGFVVDPATDLPHDADCGLPADEEELVEPPAGGEVR